MPKMNAKQRDEEEDLDTQDDEEPKTDNDDEARAGDLTTEDGPLPEARGREPRTQPR